MTRSYGSFKLTSVANLPNIFVAFPGEHWSDGKAAATVVPGALVVPSTPDSTGRKTWITAASGTVDVRAAVALNIVQPPDSNPGSLYNEALGPNQIVNRNMLVTAYVHAYRSGAFQLTLFEQAAYVAGDLLMWDPAATPQAGKTTVGAWVKTAVPANAFFEVEAFRVLPDETQKGILTVKSLRSQF